MQMRQEAIYGLDLIATHARDIPSALLPRVAPRMNRILSANATLDDAALAIGKRVNLVKRRTREALEARREIGQILVEIRDHAEIAQGGWEIWMRANLPFGTSHASECIQLHVRWPDVIAAVLAEEHAAQERKEIFEWPGLRSALAFIRPRKKDGAEATGTSEQTANGLPPDAEPLPSPPPVRTPAMAKASADASRCDAEQSTTKTSLQRLVKEQALEIHTQKALIVKLTRENEDLRFELHSVRGEAPVMLAATGVV